MLAPDLTLLPLRLAQTRTHLGLVGLLGLLLAPGLLADDGASLRVAEVIVTNRAQLDLLAESVDLWGYDERRDVAVVALTDAEMTTWLDEGWDVEVDIGRTAALASLGQPLAGQSGGIPGFPCYRTVEESLADAEALAASHPQLARWIDIGDSWEKTQDENDGYDLRVLRLGRGVSTLNRPKLMVTAALHSREYTTAELALRFGEYLVAHYDRDPDVTWLLDHHEVHLVLQANPDGRKRAEGGVLWRKNANNDYCTGSSARGADLNRNFGFQWNCCGGSSDDECSNLYRGSAATSEPETQAVEAYGRSIFPDQRPPALDQPASDDAIGVWLDVHSFGEDVLWSWGFTEVQPPEPNGSGLYTLGRKYGFYTHYRPQHGSFNTVDGPTKDFAYGELGVPGFTIELGSDFFEECPDFDNIIVRDNVAAMLYAAKVARAPYLLPSGPEVLGAAVPPVAVVAGQPVALTAVADDSRYTDLNGIEPVQNVAAVRAYVDVPPWQDGAQAVPMDAVDGVFDSPVESVEVSLATDGLSPGRYLLYLQAEDNDGHLGAAGAAFLYVIDAATAPVVQGTLRDAQTGQPLRGTVRLGDFQTTSDVNGFYQLQVPPGSYDLVTEAPNHARQNVTLQLDDLTTTVQDLDLRPYVNVWTDNADGPDPGWGVDPPWARSSEAAFSPPNAWTDSPGADYNTSTDVSITTPSLALDGLEAVVLSFQQLVDIEQHRDVGLTQISLDDGVTWQTVGFESGEDRDASWQLVEIPLPQLDGQSGVRLRFRLDSDSFTVADGWHLDDIQLRGLVTPVPGAIFLDGFESGDVGRWSASRQVSEVRDLTTH